MLLTFTTKNLQVISYHKSSESNSQNMYGWQWRNFFIPVYASCSGCHDAGQGNVNILQHLPLDRRSHDIAVSFFLNRPIQFYLTNATNFHQLTSQTENEIMPIQHGDRIVTSLHPICWAYTTLRSHCITATSREDARKCCKIATKTSTQNQTKLSKRHALTRTSVQ